MDDNGGWAGAPAVAGFSGAASLAGYTSDAPARAGAGRRVAVEWQTMAVAVAVYGGWLALTWWHDSLPLWLVFVAGGWLCAWHASLQHEIMHGHPTRWADINRWLAMPPLTLWLPYDRYRALHLAHHRDHLLTDPLEDPETQYLTVPAWVSLGPAGRGVVRLCGRLAGRLLIGPPWAITRFLRRDLRRLRSGDRAVRAAWLRHLPWLAAVCLWVFWVCRVSPLTYLLCLTWPGMALMMLRSLVEHRAAEAVAHRTAIVEGAPLLGLLYLNNNLHAAHHERPSLPWYRLPGYYKRERARLVAANGGLVYAGYADVARRFLFRPHDIPVHPGQPGQRHG